MKRTKSSPTASPAPRNPSREDYVLERLESHLADIRSDPDSACNHLYELTRLITYKLTLSGGGPADYFELMWCPTNKAWTGGRYIFQDFEGFVPLGISDDLAAELADVYCIDPECD
jgi:hypothetical protein